MSTIKKWRSKITELAGYEFAFSKIPIGYGRGRGYNWIPDFTKEEVIKFIQTSKLIDDKGLDKAIKEVWGDLNAQLEQERNDTMLGLRSVVGGLKRSQNNLKTSVDKLSSDNAKLRQRVTMLENSLSSLVAKLSENKKFKKLIE